MSFKAELAPAQAGKPQALIPTVNAWDLTVGKVGCVQTGDRSHTSDIIRDNWIEIIIN